MELNKKSFLLAIFLFCGFESYADESELAKQVQNNTESINDMQKKYLKMTKELWTLNTKL